MSQIDDELNLLKQKITLLEEQKRIEAEKEAEKKSNPLKILERILHKKKQCRDVLHLAAAEGRKPSEFPMSSEGFAWTLDQNDKAEFLEPIFTILKNIEERLQILEKKTKDPPIEDLF